MKAYHYPPDDTKWYMISSLLGESHHEAVNVRRIIYVSALLNLIFNKFMSFSLSVFYVALGVVYVWAFFVSNYASFVAENEIQLILERAPATDSCLIYFKVSFHKFLMATNRLF